MIISVKAKKYLIIILEYILLHSGIENMKPLKKYIYIRKFVELSAKNKSRSGKQSSKKTIQVGKEKFFNILTAPCNPVRTKFYSKKGTFTKSNLTSALDSYYSIVFVKTTCKL